MNRRVKTFDGLQIQSWLYRAESVTAPLVIIVHGFAEYAGRYKELIQKLNSKGYSVLTYDQRGHGESDGIRAFINDFSDYCKDLVSVYQAWKDEIQEPIFLLGHSMGGLVVIRFLETMAEQIPVKAAVLSSPLLGMAVEVPWYKRLAAEWVVKFKPDFALPSGIDPSYISHDPVIVRQYAQDPKVLKIATAGWYISTTKAIELAFADIDKLHTKLIFMVAGDDGLASAVKTKMFFEKLPLDYPKISQWFEGWYHEIFNEINRWEAQDKLIELLDAEVRS
ncbi:MAG: lysophospholipase [Bacteroidia bacterium]|nr:lysophospholipase [Bacteroidia bacterium]